VAEPEAFQHHRLDDTETGNKLQVGQFLIGIMITDEVQVVQMSVLPHVEDPGVDGRIILSWIFRKWDVERMDWIDVAQDRYRRRALVNAVMNFRIP